MRLFRKILANRRNMKLALPMLRFTFLTRDGYLVETSTVHAILCHSTTTASNLAAAFVDVSKASDSASHDTIVRSVGAFRPPLPLVRYLSEYYRKSSSLMQSCEGLNGRGV